jgi:hypothetical protein
MVISAVIIPIEQFAKLVRGRVWRNGSGRGVVRRAWVQIGTISTPVFKLALFDRQVFKGHLLKLAQNLLKTGPNCTCT